MPKPKTKLQIKPKQIKGSTKLPFMPIKVKGHLNPSCSTPRCALISTHRVDLIGYDVYLCQACSLKWRKDMETALSDIARTSPNHHPPRAPAHTRDGPT